MSVVDFDFSLVSGPRRLLHRRCSITDYVYVPAAFTEEAIITSYRFSQEIFADFLCRLDEFLHIFYHDHIPHTAIVLRLNTSHCTSAGGIHFKQFEKRKIGWQKIAWVIHCLNTFNVQIVEW